MLNLIVLCMIRADPNDKHAAGHPFIVTSLNSLYVGGGVCIAFLIITPVLLLSQQTKQPHFILVRRKLKHHVFYFHVFVLVLQYRARSATKTTTCQYLSMSLGNVFVLDMIESNALTIRPHGVVEAWVQNNSYHSCRKSLKKRRKLRKKAKNETLTKSKIFIK